MLSLHRSAKDEAHWAILRALAARSNSANVLKRPVRETIREIALSRLAGNRRMKQDEFSRRGSEAEAGWALRGWGCGARGAVPCPASAHSSPTPRR